MTLRLFQQPIPKPCRDAGTMAEQDLPAAKEARAHREALAAAILADAEPLTPGLYLVATPIGNLKDITLRALGVLARADAVACEDTRRTGQLLHHYGLSTAMLPYHDHNAARQRPKLLAELKSGAAVALVSDAGTPLISDPGYKLVSEAARAGVAVMPVPGPSALLAALTVSGLPTDRFLFQGFLPAKTQQRRSRLEEIAAIPATLVLFETAPRLAETLADLTATMGDRPAAVAHELTKLHESCDRGTLAELAAGYARDKPRGEYVLVIGPPEDTPADPAAIDEALQGALKSHSLRESADLVSGALGIPRRQAYQRALALAKAPPEPGT